MSIALIGSPRRLLTKAMAVAPLAIFVSPRVMRKV